MKLSAEELKGLAGAALSALVPEDDYAAQVMYGEYQNAIVVHFRFSEAYNAEAESMDNALERLFGNRFDAVVEAIEEWAEDNLAE